MSSFSPVGIEEKTVAPWGGDPDSMWFCVEVVRTFEAEAPRLLTGRGLPLFAQRALVYALLRTHIARRHEIALLRVTEVTRGENRRVVEVGFSDVAEARRRAKEYIAKLHAGGRFTG